MTSVAGKERPKLLIDKALKQLEASLKQGKSESLKNYLRILGRLHHYSLHNLILIANQRPDATLVRGFRAWNKFGRHVKKGEKGIAIVAPIVRKHDCSTAEKDELGLVCGFRRAFVFDVSQTEGKPIPRLARRTGNPGKHIKRLHALMHQKGIELEYVDPVQSFEGRSLGGKIQIVRGLQPAEEFSVLVHEIAHELLHHQASRRVSKATRETEAEAVAFSVCSAVGLEATRAATDYIQLQHGDEHTLLESLKLIQQTARVIIGQITNDAIKEKQHEAASRKTRSNYSRRSTRRCKGQRRKNHRLLLG